MDPTIAQGLGMLLLSDILAVLFGVIAGWALLSGALKIILASQSRKQLHQRTFHKGGGANQAVPARYLRRSDSGKRSIA